MHADGSAAFEPSDSVCVTIARLLERHHAVEELPPLHRTVDLDAVGDLVEHPAFDGSVAFQHGHLRNEVRGDGSVQIHE